MTMKKRRLWSARNAKKIHEAIRGDAINHFGRKNRAVSSRGKARQKRAALTPEDCVKKYDAHMARNVQDVDISFDDLVLAPHVRAAVRAAGFTRPLPIQARVIPLILAGRDVIGLAQTGMGKTAAFLLPLLTRLHNGDAKPPIVILTPTRELAQQIATDIVRFGGDDLRTAVLYGGGNMRTQARALAVRPHVIVATPGRLRDFMESGAVALATVRTVVIDEVDRMVDTGFLPTVRVLLAAMHRARQTLVFSATLAKDVRPVVRKMLRNPVTVAITPRPTAATVEQDIVWVGPTDDKVELLHDALIAPEVTKALVFVNTKADALALAAELTARGFAAAALQGDLSQGARRRITQQFTDGAITVLVATDVAARGLDVPDISHVINFDPPALRADYVHRIGRTGRAGARGYALTFWPRR